MWCSPISVAVPELRRVTCTTTTTTTTTLPSYQRLRPIHVEFRHGDDEQNCCTPSAIAVAATSSALDVDRLPSGGRPLNDAQPVNRPVAQPSSSLSSAAARFSIDRILDLDRAQTSQRPSRTAAAENVANSFDGRCGGDVGTVVNERYADEEEVDDDYDDFDDDQLSDLPAQQQHQQQQQKQQLRQPQVGVPFMPGWLWIAGWPLKHQNQVHRQQIFYHKNPLDTPLGLPTSIGAL